MKRYVKLYEEFNPEEFLEDFGVDLFTPKSLIGAINRRGWRHPEVKEILLSGFDKGTYAYKESDDFIKEPGKIVVRAKSRFDLDKYTSIGFVHINAFIDKFPKDAHLNINWVFTFTEKLHDTYKVIDVSCSFEAKNNRLYNFSNTQGDGIGPATEADWKTALEVAVENLDDLFETSELTLGLNSKDEKRVGLQRRFAEYCKMYYSHENHKDELNFDTK